jgi:hypothetical protein
VASAAENRLAVQAQAALQSLVSAVEKARKACKEPVLTIGRKIDQAAKDFVNDVDADLIRVSRLIGDFAQLEQARARAAEKLHKDELSRLERERAEAQAKATSHDELDQIAEDYCQKAAAIQTPPEPVRADGQRITNDWEIVVTDIHKLYRHRPYCVKLEPLLAEIKNLLRDGTTPEGVLAKPIVKASVRLSAAPQTIDV